MLLHNDEILIQDYRLRFEDPAKTRPLVSPQPIGECPWVFNVGETKLYRVDTGTRTERHLPPQLTTLLSYMANQNINNRPEKVCKYKELEGACFCTREQLYNIVKKIRSILSEADKHSREDTLLDADESNKKDTQKWFETKAGEGYILKIACEK